MAGLVQPPGGPDRRGPGELETEVLAALWAVGQALTPAQVQRELGDRVAYNTVQTILSRLLDKGLVQREPAGRAHRYQPTRGQAELAAEQMHAVLARGRDHTAVLQRFLTALSDTDRESLRELVRSQPPHPATPPEDPGG